MCPARLGKLKTSFLGERRVQAAPIGRTAQALDKAGPLEPVDEARQSALAQQRAIGEFAHAQPPVLCAVEEQQHLELVERQPVGLDELAIELVDERGVDPDEATPGLPLPRFGCLRNSLHTQIVQCVEQFRRICRKGESYRMRFEGVHHVTCITGDAPGNVDFYVRVLGLRLVKKSVNQDDPTVYHLFYADDQGSAGADITFFEYPGARRGRAGDGMIHTITFRVADAGALDFWEARLGAEGVATRRDGDRLGFDDPEGLGLELAAVATNDAPLVAFNPEIPEAHAIQGFDGVRAFGSAPERSRPLLEEVMGFEARDGTTWELRGASRGGMFGYDPPPASGPGVPGAGTVHHVAWSSTMADHEEWQRRVTEAGYRPTPVIDRFWFRSVYFREPSGVLFELATLGPGFGVDEDADHLGEALILPPAFEHLRAQVEKVLTPIHNPREDWR